MSLRDIVRAVGGDLYDGGMRANIPAPGHSREDRSVSLMWSGGRVLVHSFGRTHWRDVLDHLKSLGVGGAETSGPAPWPLRPTAEGRIALARRLWAATRPLIGTLGERHLRQRRIARSAPGAIRFGPAAPISVYAESSACRPALVAAILEPRGAL
ncbi:MAG TPA: virulence-associated protein E, partial [Phenylobacterium sp.]|nr:virulence-associated protein E [Phenylobacterium sp.]